MRLRFAQAHKSAANLPNRISNPHHNRKKTTQVSHAVQAQLPSAKYLGHNLYASTLELFEARLLEARLLGEQRQAAADTSTAAVVSDSASSPPADDAAPDAAASGGAAAAPPAAAADDGSAAAAELNFLATWRQRGAPAVVISYVAAAAGSASAAASSAASASAAAAAAGGHPAALATLRHELCHARFALRPAYRHAVEAAWAGPHGKAKLEKWLGALVRE